MSREAEGRVPGATTSHRRRRRRAVAFGLLAVGLGLVAWSVMFFTRPGILTLPIPNPNGYDDLLGAARSIAGTSPKYRIQLAQVVRLSDGPGAIKLDPMAATWDEARAFLEANRDALAMARVGLDRECVVPIAYEPGYAFFATKNRKAILDLAQVFLWEGRLAVREGRHAEAARSFLDLARLGHASAGGGVEVDFWLGNDIATGGLLGLVRICDELDSATCRHAIGIVESLERDREPYTSFRMREKASQVSEQGRFRNAVWSLANFRRLDRERVLLDASVDEVIAHARLVQIELALRAFEAEKGQEPADLSSLVPSYLPNLPLDPYTGKSSVYHRVGQGHVLYSLGENRLDDGGVAIPRNRAQPTAPGDILPDSLGSTLAP